MVLGPSAVGQPIHPTSAVHREVSQHEVTVFVHAMTSLLTAAAARIYDALTLERRWSKHMIDDLRPSEVAEA